METNFAPANDSWYGLRTKSKFEKVTPVTLAHKSYQSYLLHRQRPRWTDRITGIESPLFAGYVFCLSSVPLPPKSIAIGSARLDKKPGVALMINFDYPQKSTK